MIKRAACILVILVTNLLTIIPNCHAGALTAQPGLAKATKSAITWKPDAVFTGVSTTALKQDGTAIVWTYNYLSPATVNCARVIIISGGEPRLQDLGKCTPSNPVSTSFVDSPEMLKAAIKAGFKPAEESNAYLKVMHDQLAVGKPCWVVHTAKDFENGYMRGWCVDPKTGKFVVRLSGKVAYKKK